jgi:hypothetical protein
MAPEAPEISEKDRQRLRWERRNRRCEARRLNGPRKGRFLREQAASTTDDEEVNRFFQET